MWQMVLLLGSVVWAYVGGWATITVEELPDYALAGAPMTLTFTVRQHGARRLSGLSPAIEAHAGSASTATAPVRPGRDAGQYDATLTLPTSGEWTITIHSGFGNSRVALLPLRVVAAGTRPPSPLSEAERGRRLFVAKGCLTCHLHGDVEGSGTVAVGPELTNRRLAADYLKGFLANPAIAARAGTFQMPNLELKDPEIRALAAFLSAEREALR